MSRQALVLDANILIRAVLGNKVIALIETYQNTTTFFAPDEAFLGSGVATWTTETVAMYLAAD